MSRIFMNMKEALNEIERDIHEMGIKVHPETFQNKWVKDDPNFDTLEVQNYSFTILDMSDKNSCVANEQWCYEEFSERISEYFRNPGTAWKLRESVWKEFLNANGEMDYTYNERMNGFKQIKYVIEELKENPDSRQAIIHVHYPEDIINSRKKDPYIRVPCSMYYQLMIRRGKLDIIYNMRSSDYYTHFPNDIWLADELRNYIAEAIRVPAGLLMMNIGSLHMYRNYTKKVVF